jgi:predicted sugar kinase
MVISLQLKQQQTMKVTIKTTVTSEAEVEIELPAFFMNKSCYYAVLSDDQIILIDDFQEMRYIGFGHGTRAELSVSKKITFREFYPAFRSATERARRFITQATNLLAPIADLYADEVRFYDENNNPE